jgi:hypothetical protein
MTTRDPESASLSAPVRSDVPTLREWCGHSRLVMESIYRCKDCGVRGPLTGGDFTPFDATLSALPPTPAVDVPTATQRAAERIYREVDINYSGWEQDAVRIVLEECGLTAQAPTPKD